MRVFSVHPNLSVDLPADDLRRASHAATKRWSAAIEAGLATMSR
jgi:hypothetical protein